MVDDSHSMRPHWKRVEELVKLLVYIVKKKDRDGCDLYFLSSPVRHRPGKRASKAAELVREHKPTAEAKTIMKTNLNWRLDEDVDKYIDELGDSSSSHSRRCIYILTDGELEGGDDDQGHHAIERLVTKLRSLGKGKGYVGIQFISFGNSKDGLARLNRLDQLSQELKFGL